MTDPIHHLNTDTEAPDDEEGIHVLNKKGGVVMGEFVTGSGAYIAVRWLGDTDRHSKGTEVAVMSGDTSWGITSLGTNTLQSLAVMEAASARRLAGDHNGSRNMLSQATGRAARMLSEVTFPEHDQAANGMHHGENVMLVSSGSLAVTVALRSAQQYFRMKTETNGIQGQILDAEEQWLKKEAPKDLDPLTLKAFLRKGVEGTLRNLPEEAQNDLYGTLVQAALAHPNSTLVKQVFKHRTDIPVLPDIDTVLNNAPPKARGPVAIFAELTGIQPDEKGVQVLEKYLREVARDKISQAVDKVEKRHAHALIPLSEVETDADTIGEHDHKRTRKTKEQTRHLVRQLLDQALCMVVEPYGALLANSPSYHGAGEGPTGVSDGPKTYAEYNFSPDNTLFIHTPYPYRQKGADEPEEAYCARLLRDVERRILQAGGKGRVAAIVIEPVSGSSLGGVVPPKGYLAGLRTLSEKYGPEDGRILLIYDEVMSGMGRTGDFAAYRDPAVAGDTITPPDIQLYSKAVASAGDQMAGVVFNPEIFAEMKARGVLPEYSATTQNYPPGAAAIVETLNQLHELKENDGLRQRQDELLAMVREYVGASTILEEHIGEIRGFGGMFGIELVDDREHKGRIREGYDLSYAIYRTLLVDECLSSCPVRAGSDALGNLVNSDTIFFLPPYIMNSLDNERLVRRLVRGMERAVCEAKGMEYEEPVFVASPAAQAECEAAVREFAQNKGTLERLTIGSDGAECVFRPENADALDAFRQALMKVAGGYAATPEEGGKALVFRLTAEQVEDLNAYRAADREVFHVMQKHQNGREKVALAA